MFPSGWLLRKKSFFKVKNRPEKPALAAVRASAVERASAAA
jgi:hypothetical protein